MEYRVELLTERLHLRRARKGDAAVLFSTHILSDVETLCDRVCILKKGKVVVAGPPEVVAKAAQSRTAPYLARFGQMAR